MMTSIQRTIPAYPHSDLSPWQAIVVRFLSCITSKTQAAIFGVVIGFCTGCLIGKSYFSTVTETVRTVETVRTIETPRAPITSIDLRCDPQEESTRFTDVMNGGVCFDNTGWLSLFLESDPEPEKTIVSVGCNKGEGLADLYAMFDNSQTPFISDLWKEAAIEELKKRGDKQFPYGYCDQLNSPSVLDRGQFDPKFPKKSPSAFCVEPMRDNLNLLKSCHEKSRISDNFKIWQYAVGIPDGKKMVRFPDGVGGEEGYGIDQGGPRITKWVDVPFESLDGLFGKLDSVDLLFVDAEGNDADVLFGGEQTLKKTRYLEFEVHV